MLNNSLILFVAITPFIAWTLYREVRNRGVTAFFFSCFWLWFVYILSPFFLNLYPERIANSRFDISFLALDDALPLFFCAAGVFFFVLGSWASKKVVFSLLEKSMKLSLMTLKTCGILFGCFVLALWHWLRSFIFMVAFRTC